MLVQDAETALVSRCKDILVLLGMSTSQDGTNADLADAIASSARRTGYTTSSVFAAADPDLIAVNASDVDRLIDLAELALLETLLTRSRSRTSTMIGFDRFEWQQVAQGLEVTLARRTARFDATYGVSGLGPVSAPILSTYVTPGSSPYAGRYQPPGREPYPGGPTWP